MYYCICLENNQVVSVLDYKPNVPKSVTLIPIVEDEYKKLASGKYAYDPDSKNIVPINLEPHTNRDTTDKQFLEATDWKILRHVREKSLNVATSITEEDYLSLERERHMRAKRIGT